jgi:gliding motility-associated-like protein
MLVNKGSAIPNYWLDISEATYTIQNDQIDTVILQFTFRNQYGCFKRDTVSFEIWRVPKIQFQDGRDLCWDEGEIDLNELFDVNWTDGYWTTPATAGYRDSSTLGGLTDSSMINTLNSVELNQGQTPNRFYLRYHHNSTGCYAFNDTTLLINPLPDVNITGPADDSKYCNTADPVALTATPGGGTWTSTDPAALAGSTFNPQSATILNSDIWIYYDYTNPNTGCESSDSTYVSVEPQPTVNIDPIDPFCRTKGSMTETIDLTATTTNIAADQLNWSAFALTSLPGVSVSKSDNGASTSLTLNMNNDTINEFYVNIATEFNANSACAQDQAEIVITVYPIPEIAIAPTNPNGCEPVETDFELTTFNAVDPTHPSTLYEWTLDDQNSSTVPNPIFEYTVPGTNDVSLKFTSEYGCDTTVFTSVDVYPNPVAAFTPDPNNFTTAALPRFKFTDESDVTGELGSVIDTWSWDFGSPFSSPLTSTEQNPGVFYNTDTATYTVKLVVETNYGCKDSTEREVVVGPDLIVYIPNAFTPNGFGPEKNDAFNPIISGEKTMEMIIFNRWGEIMFQTDNKEDQWDGTYKGIECQQDVYAYQLKVTALNDEVYTYTGTITLIR